MYFLLPILAIELSRATGGLYRRFWLETAFSTIVSSLSRQVRAYVVGSKAAEEAAGGGADCHSQAHGHWIVDTPIANPSSYQADSKTSRKSWGIDALGTVVVEVELISGITGVGISIGGAPACYIVEEHLARFCEGQGAFYTFAYSTFATSRPRRSVMSLTPSRPPPNP